MTLGNSAILLAQRFTIKTQTIEVASTGCGYSFLKFYHVEVFCFGSFRCDRFRHST